MISLIKILTVITYSALVTTTNLSASQVLELNDKFLDICQDGQWLIMMYTPCCADCKKMEPVWGHVAEDLHATSIRVRRVDCSRFTSIAQTFKIKGFPTIMFFKGIQQFVYNGDRTRDEIVHFAHRLSGLPVLEVTKTKSFNNSTDHHKLGDRNKLNKTSYKWDNDEHFPTFRRFTRGVVEENQLREPRSTDTNCTNCENCINCINCINCKNCINCTNCTNCTDCRDCTGCTDCQSCRDCTSCMNCLSCADCKGCTRCSQSRDCTNCTDCTDCRDCRDCRNCKSCRDSTNCTNCRDRSNCVNTTCTNTSSLKKVMAENSKAF